MLKRFSSYRSRGTYGLNNREQDILRLVVTNFIDKAGPVGSRYLAEEYALGISPASIRNTLSGLEERGYLDHPHTSAGRVPTDLGYRAFVDLLMTPMPLSAKDRSMLQKGLQKVFAQPDIVLKEGSRILGRLSNLLGVVLRPKLATGVLDRLEAIPLSASRLMFVLSLRGGLVKTIMLELDTVLKRDQLGRVVTWLNERLAGLTLDEIRRTCVDRTKDLQNEPSGLVRLILESSTAIFSSEEDNRVAIAGAQHMIDQPEFLEEPIALRTLIENLENENFVVQLFEDETRNQDANEVVPGRARVRIGRENNREDVSFCSVVSAHYQVGDTVGTIGIIGPKRMDYTRMVVLVETMASLLSQPSGKKIN